jgi:hypothetical protein
MDLEKMDENEDINLDPDVQQFLGEPITRLEAIQLIQPLRSLMLPLIQASISSISILATSENEENREMARKAFQELGGVFEEIELFDLRVGRLFKGRKTWDDEEAEGPDSE